MQLQRQAAQANDIDFNSSYLGIAENINEADQTPLVTLAEQRYMLDRLNLTSNAYQYTRDCRGEVHVSMSA